MDEVANQLESPIPPAIVRGLGDRSYDKRKNAAVEVTTLIKSLQVISIFPFHFVHISAWIYRLFLPRRKDKKQII